MEFLGKIGLYQTAAVKAAGGAKRPDSQVAVGGTGTAVIAAPDDVTMEELLAEEENSSSTRPSRSCRRPWRRSRPVRRPSAGRSVQEAPHRGRLTAGCWRRRGERDSPAAGRGSVLSRAGHRPGRQGPLLGGGRQDPRASVGRPMRRGLCSGARVGH